MNELNWLRCVVFIFTAFVLGGCVAHPYGSIQFRMTEPLVAVDLPDPIQTAFVSEDGNTQVVAQTGNLDPPTILFKKYRTRTGVDAKKYISVIAQKPWPEYENDVPKTERLFLQPIVFGDSEKAFFVWDNPNAYLRNWVNLDHNAIYRMAVVLPERYELRRLQLLQAKAETLYKAIEIADNELREHTHNASLLLSEDARGGIISDLRKFRRQLSDAHLALQLLESNEETTVLDEDIVKVNLEITRNENILRRDDFSRDRNLSPALTDSLANQIEDYRADLEKIKGRIIALELMVQNPNEPYPRVIHGWLETLDESPFTRIGSIPFALEDEYIDWIRSGKNVTIVFYDPNVLPDDPGAASYRKSLPEFWPSGDLMIYEFQQKPVASYRSATGGTTTGTAVSREIYSNVIARSFRDRGGYTRTYLQSEDRSKLWVFGPDLTPPSNIEVWTVDPDRGIPDKRLYPAEPAGNAQGGVNVRQIAGVEGGAFDPIDEAAERGQIVAVAFLGNWRTQQDHKLVHSVYEYLVKALVPGVDPTKKGRELGRIYQASGEAHRIYKKETSRSD